MNNISVGLGSIYSDLNLRLDTFESSVTKALQGFYKLQTKTQQASSIMDKSVCTAVGNIEKSYRLWEQSNEHTGKNLLDNSKKIESYKDRIKLLDDEIKKSEKTLEDIEKQYGKNSKEAEEYKSHVLDLKLSHAELTDEMKEAERETTTFAGKMKILGREFEKIDKKYENFDKVGDKFKSVGSKLTMGVTLPLAGAGVAAGKFAMDFETGAAKVSTIADTTKVSMNTLKKGVIDMSNKTGMGTKELNEALYETLSAGVDTAKSVDFLGVAVKAAKGGFTDTATAVDGLTTTLNSYGLEADKANNIANQMLITQNLGKTTFGELASAVGKVTPVASALGVKTEELFSSLATTTAQGLATAESVTALKAAMSNIIKPSKEASDAAEMLGIKFKASEVKTKGWMPFLQDLNVKLRQASPEFAKMSGEMSTNAKRMSELEKAGKKSSKEYRELSKANKGLSKDMELMAKASDSPLSAFATMFGSVEGLNSVLMMTSENGMNLYNKSMEEMKSNTTALDDAYKKMSETTQEKFNKGLNKLKNSAMELGVKLLPVAEKGINLLSKLADWMGNLSPTTQEWIIKIGLASAAMGPFLSGIGGTIKGVTGLLKTGKKLGTFFGLFKGAEKAAIATKGIGVATGAATKGISLMGIATKAGALLLNPWTIGIGAAVVGGVALAKHLKKDCIPAVDLFGDKTTYTTKQIKGLGQVTEKNTVKISKETKKQLGSYLQLDDKATKAMMSLKFNSTKITKENAKGITDTYNKMAKQTVDAIVKKNKKETDEMKKFFAKNSILTDKEEKKILEKKQKQCDFEKNIVDQGNKKIREIMDNASKKKRELTAEEQRIINNIQDNMKQSAVKHMSQSEVEQKVIMERLKNEAGNITAKQAAEVIKNSAKARDKTVADANKKYNDTVAWAIRERDENGTISAEEADKIITAAEREKNTAVQHAKDMHSDVVRHASEQCREHINEIDTETGEVKSKWQRLKDWFSNNPITRWIKSKVSGDDVGQNWAGTNYWKGGLTTLHEKGYELYDLPKGTRVYNHEASKDLVKRTAKQVAQDTLSSLDSMVTNSIMPQNVKQEIIIPVSLDGKEVARITAPYMSNNLAMGTKRRR